MGIVSMLKSMGYKKIKKASPELGDKAILFIQENFPELEEDIETFASEQNVERGDIAVATITDIILPELEALGVKK